MNEIMEREGQMGFIQVTKENGEYITNEQMNDKRFLKLISQ